MTKYGPKCYYAKGITEIVFINGKADWITVNGMSHASFDKRSLALLGFSVHTPTFENDWTMRWESISGFLDVSFFLSDSNIDYAYIKVKTK